MNDFNEHLPGWVKNRGEYWYKKTGTHFQGCFGTYPLEELDKVPSHHGACPRNVQKYEKTYDACRECQKTTWELAKERKSLDYILGLL